MDKIDLKEVGLKENTIKEFENSYNDLYLGRVICEQKNSYRVITEKDVINAKVSGKMMFNALDKADFPAVGDWVALDREDSNTGDAVIHGVLKRFSKFSRKVAGDRHDEQLIAVNVDTAFIAMSLNNNFNLRRLERYISTAWDSGAEPAVVLTKADLCEDLSEKLDEVSKIAMGVKIFVVSSLTNEGVDEVRSFITKGKTVVFLGSSGVGKSTLINSLMGNEVMKVGEVREGDDKGKHTTTYRELMVLKDGGVVIDTPGMRELQILDISEGIESSFKDIEDIALNCKFGNCTHKSEPGCAVREAIMNGVIPEERYKNYVKLKKEAEFMARKERLKDKEIIKKTKGKGLSKRNFKDRAI